MGPSKCLKQLIQIKLNRVKESQLARGKPAGSLQVCSRIWTWDYREQIQLAVRTGLELGASEFQVQRLRIWTRDYREQIQLAVRAGLELGVSELQGHRSNHLATLPPQNKQTSYFALLSIWWMCIQICLRHQSVMLFLKWCTPFLRKILDQPL